MPRVAWLLFFASEAHCQEGGPVDQRAKRLEAQLESSCSALAAGEQLHHTVNLMNHTAFLEQLRETSVHSHPDRVMGWRER